MDWLPCGGCPWALTPGVRNSAGKYFQFLDADDLIEPRKLERQIEYLEQHPDIDIVYGDTRFFQSENPAELLYSMWGENRPWQPGISGCGAEVLLPLLQLNTIPINAPLTRRSIVERVGPFDEELPQNEDWDLWLRLSRQSSVCLVDEEMTFYRGPADGPPGGQSQAVRRAARSCVTVARGVSAAATSRSVRQATPAGPPRPVPRAPRSP